MTEQPIERRSRQRICTTQQGLGAFWLDCGLQTRLRVVDLSLEGCGVISEALPGNGDEVRFILTREGSSAQVRGNLQAVNLFAVEGVSQSGCRFRSFEADGRDVLWSWLTRHVLDCSALPLRLDEAEKIVSGPSIV